MFHSVPLSPATPALAGEPWTGHPQVYPGGVELYRQGTMLEDVFRIQSGIVKMVWTGGDGEEAILLLAFPGAWLGAAPILARKPTPVSAATCETTIVCRLPAETFRSLLQTDPELSAAIHQMQALELCRQTTWFAQRGTLTARQRLEWILRQFIAAAHPAEPQAGTRVHLPLHRWELARLIGISPEHLCRITKQMQDEGVIRCERGWITVPEVDRLSAGSKFEEVPWCAAITPRAWQD